MSQLSEQIAFYMNAMGNQMNVLASVSSRFYKAIQIAKQNGVSKQFQQEAEVLFQELKGQPGDKALEVLDTLDRDINHVSEFIEKWDTSSDSNISNTIIVLRDVYAELDHLAVLVAQAPMSHIKAKMRNERIDRYFQQRPYLYLFRGLMTLLFLPLFLLVIKGYINWSIVVGCVILILGVIVNVSTKNALKNKNASR